ncbi:hypothetical protein QF046_000908 [Microbacterium sp. W4I4]|uniref:DUF2877 domain-containing protein n=1 Tax=Microbacterium sp. W4I4 TaxID=3042295 RepID=UPI0027820947|nr:DUF2877 domain-containing protein [Microbacterium sp. W4I4]MDQ0613267.1 hypothetical protein [Microbacterium sp. W4I4]
MTPVAPLVAFRATTWDAALEETLSRAAEHRRVSGVPAIVHSVHQRVLNILVDGALIAVAHDDLDDAPSTIRTEVSNWAARGVAQGAPVHIDATGIRIPAADGTTIAIDLSPDAAWTPAPVDLSALTVDDIDAALHILSDFTAPQAMTDFGRAAAAPIAERLDALRHALLAGPPAPITAASERLIGLGEGLTPTGDDILTGFAFLAAQPGMHGAGRLTAIEDAVRGADDLTGLLSLTTMRHALRGRGRQCLHDLAAAVEAGDAQWLRTAAALIQNIGHTSGADILTGVRIALEIECALRAAPDTTTPHLIDEKEN